MRLTAGIPSQRQCRHTLNLPGSLLIMTPTERHATLRVVLSLQGQISMKRYHVVAGCWLVRWFALSAGRKLHPFPSARVFPLPLQAGLKCGLVNGELKCGNSNSSGKHHDDNDDQQENNDEHHHKKKKNTDDDFGLEHCTIQSSKGGGGCVAPLKYVCEKLKSGKKCCGCVVDKNAKPANNPAPAPVAKFCCTAAGQGSASKTCQPTEAEARKLAAAVQINGKPPETITCALNDQLR